MAKKSSRKVKIKHHQRATWDGLFGRAEALERGESTFRTLARSTAVAATAEVASTAARIDALIGIWWTDPTFPIFYDVLINNTPLPPPNSSRTGEVIRPIELLRGQRNLVAWTIQHMGQGWKHRLFLKFADQVIALESAEDPSNDTSDDLTFGSTVVDVPA